eukprot:9498993-Pyramimonas_sp.AAC.1
MAENPEMAENPKNPRNPGMATNPAMMRTGMAETPAEPAPEATMPDPLEKASKESMWAKFYANKDKMFVFEAVRTLVLPLREPEDGPATFTVDEYLSDPERLVRIVYGDPQFTRTAPDRWVIKLIAISILKWKVLTPY